MAVIDLFSGAGGLTEGFIRAGANIIAHVEKDKWACETLKSRILFHELNKLGRSDLYWDYCINSNGKRIEEDRDRYIYKHFPHLKEYVEHLVLNRTFGDPQSPTDDIINSIKENLSLSGDKRVTAIIGGPPCQAYSLAGRGRMKEKAAKDSRNFLFRYYKEIVSEFEPSLFIMENVPGILTAHNGAILSAIKDEFLEIGYDFITGINQNDNENILNAADFGIPQIRRRMLMIGFNKRKIDKERYFDFYFELLNYKKRSNRINTESAISDLPYLGINEGNNHWFKKYEQVNIPQKLSTYQSNMRKDSVGIMNHFSRFHNENDRNIYREAIFKSATGKKIQYYELPEDWKTHKNQHSFTDRYKVHGMNEVPHTIVAHISKDGHYNIHPDINQCRSLTVREAARIQSFPDNYKFEGPRAAQYVQVGNAVPPILAEAAARAIKSCYFGAK